MEGVRSELLVHRWSLCVVVNGKRNHRGIRVAPRVAVRWATVMSTETSSLGRETPTERAARPTEPRTYEVRTYLLREGRIVAAVSRPLPVGKVGFSAQLAGWADNDGPLYGLGAILMALLVGWAGGAVMRRI